MGSVYSLWTQRYFGGLKEWAWTRWRVSFPAFLCMWDRKTLLLKCETKVWWHPGDGCAVQCISYQQFNFVRAWLWPVSTLSMIPLFLSCCLRSWMFLLRQRQEQSCQASPPHAARKVTFRETLFPPKPKHTALFFPGSGPEKWVFTWEGSCMLPEATVTLLDQGYSPLPEKTLVLLSNNDESTFVFKNTHTHSVMQSLAQ